MNDRIVFKLKNKEEILKSVLWDKNKTDLEEISNRLSTGLKKLGTDISVIDKEGLFTIEIQGTYNKEKVLFYLYERIIKFSEEIIEFPLLEECRETLFLKNELIGSRKNDFCVKTLSHKIQSSKILYRAYFNSNKMTFIQKFSRNKRTGHLLKAVQSQLGKEQFTELFKESDLMGEKGFLLIENCWHFIKNNEFLMNKIYDQNVFYSILNFVMDKEDSSYSTFFDKMNEIFTKGKIPRKKAKIGCVKNLFYGRKWKPFSKLQRQFFSFDKETSFLFCSILVRSCPSNIRDKFINNLSFTKCKIILDYLITGFELIPLNILVKRIENLSEDNKKEFCELLLTDNYLNNNGRNFTKELLEIIIKLNYTLMNKLSTEKIADKIFIENTRFRYRILSNEEKTFILDNRNQFKDYFIGRGYSVIHKLSSASFIFLMNNKIIDFNFITNGKIIDTSNGLDYSPLMKFRSFDEFFREYNIKNKSLKRDIINKIWNNNDSLIMWDSINKIIVLKTVIPNIDEQLLLPILNNSIVGRTKNKKHFKELTSFVFLLKEAQFNQRRIVKLLIDKNPSTTVFKDTIYMSHSLLNYKDEDPEVSEFIKNSVKGLGRKSKKIINIHDELSIILRKLEQKDFSLKQIAIEDLHNKSFQHENKKYSFFVPDKNHTLIEIGTSLNICVGNGYYARKIIDNNIFIICLKDENDKFYACIEIDRKSNRVIQSKCQYNNPCKLMPIGTKMKDFIEKYKME